MRIVFLGTPDIAVPSLEAIARTGHEVRLVVSQPDRARNRGQAVQPTPVHAAADRLYLPCVQPAKIKLPAFAELLAAQEADAFVIVAYGRIIPDHLLALAPDRWINMHPSLLPRYRGPAPVQGPLFAGDRTTGVSTMLLVSEMDAGDVLLQWETPIQSNETAGELHDRLAMLGSECLTATLELLEAGTLTPTPQDHAQATYTHKLTKADGALDFTNPAEMLANQTRAVTPWPGATATMQDELWKLWHVEASTEPHGAAPGTIIEARDDRIVVACGEGCLVIRELQRPGKQRMTATTFLRGRPIPDDSRFDSTTL